MRWVCMLLVFSAVLALPRRLGAETIAHWRFEEGPAGSPANGELSILDSSANNLHGTPFGGPVYRTVDNPGSSLGLEFDGVDDRVFIDDDPLLELTESLTLEAFVRIDSYDIGADIIFRGDDRGGLDPFVLHLYGGSPDPAMIGKLMFHINAGLGEGRTRLYSPSPLPLHQMLHVAGTLDDATGAMKLFIDGNVVVETTTHRRAFGPLDFAARPRVSIGNLSQFPTDAFFDGIIDEVRISDVALHPSEFIPEPSTLVLLTMSALTLTIGWWRRRRAA